MTEDKHSGFVSQLNSPAGNASQITPNDTSDIEVISRGLYVGGAGDLRVTMLGGQTVTFEGLTAGTSLAIRVSRVHATSTTATSIVALW